MEYRRFAPVAIAGVFVFGGCDGRQTSQKTSIRYELAAPSDDTEARIADVAYNMKITPQERYAQLEALKSSMGDKAFWDAAYAQVPALQQRRVDSVEALGVAIVISAAQQLVESRQQELVSGKEYNPSDILDSTALNAMPGGIVGTDGNTYIPVRTVKTERVFKQVRD